MAELVTGVKDGAMTTEVPLGFFSRHRSPITAFLGGGVVG